MLRPYLENIPFCLLLTKIGINIRTILSILMVVIVVSAVEFPERNMMINNNDDDIILLTLRSPLNNYVRLEFPEPRR